MNFETVEKIANAVLYEGYMLYPYRPSSIKNRQRWNFGTLYPRTFAEEQHPTETFSLRAECLAEADSNPRLTVRVRFLHLDPAAAPKQTHWVEGVERDSETQYIIRDLIDNPLLVPLRFGSLSGRISLYAKCGEGALITLGIELANVTPVACVSREEALPYAFSSVHLLLGIEGGSFVSLLDPPQQYRQSANDCHNMGLYPVLVGDADRRDKMLCSPIILYDYPEVAPESAGDFFDGTEMDEMLSLRVLTLTDEERAEMKSSDVRSRQLLERTETLSVEHLMKLHGAIRGLRRVREKEGE